MSRSENLYNRIGVVYLLTNFFHPYGSIYFSKAVLKFLETDWPYHLI